MGLREQLKTLMWQHGVEQEDLLDALHWKVRKLMDDRRYQYTAAQYERLQAEIDRLREALVTGKTGAAVKALEWWVYPSLNQLLAFDPFGNELARMDDPSSKSTEEVERFKAAAQADFNQRILSCLETGAAE